MFANFLKGILIFLLLGFLSLFPLLVLRKVGRMLGRLLWYLRGRSRKATELNLQHCFPQMSLHERQQLARRSLMESATTLMEMSAIWFWPRVKIDGLIKKVSGMEHFDAARKKTAEHPGPVILLMPHFGNWEIVGNFVTRLAPFTALYAPGKIKHLDTIMYRGRVRNGCLLAPANTQGVKALLKALRRGEVIGILPDQVPAPESGVYAPFFGQPAFTMTLAATLASRTGACVLCCYAKRLHRECGFEICLLPAEPGLLAADTVEAATALNRSMERCVLDDPAQYQWEYKRFREDPSGGKNIYKLAR